MNEIDRTMMEEIKSEPTPVVSVSPVVLSVPGRQVDLERKVSVPATGTTSS